MKKFFYVFLIILGLGIFSSVQAAISPPQPISPCNNEITSLTPTLKWQASPSVSAYRWLVKDRLPPYPIVISGDNGIIGKYTPENPPATETTIPNGKLNLGKEYKWSVIVWDKDGWPSEESPECLFQIQKTPSQPVIPTAGQPFISSFNPESGPRGSFLEIIGGNFNPDCSRNIINFNQKLYVAGGVERQEKCSSGNETKIKVMVPDWLTNGNVEIKIIANGKESNPRIFSVAFVAAPTTKTLGAGVTGPRTNCPSPTTGLVPCGTEGCPCQFCDFFVMTNNIVKWIFTFVPIIAALMLAIGGGMFFFAGAKPDMLRQAKGVITSVVIGLIIIFAAWVIVNTVISQLGIVKTPSVLQWYDIGCK